MPKTDDKEHLKILSPAEIEALYGLPRFTQDEREQYFALLPAERAALEELGSQKSRLYCVLQMGYFKARQRFFKFRTGEVEADANYVQALYWPDLKLTDFTVNKETRLKQHDLILTLYDYRRCNKHDREQLAQKARQVARLSSHPVYVFREVMAYLKARRLIAPGYTVLRDLISQALSFEEDRLINLAQTHLDAETVIALQALLQNPARLYEITHLKREPKDFTRSEINDEVRRGQQIRDLYQAARRILPLLAISNESIKYYASLISYYTVSRLKQRDEDLARIYLLCYVHFRYQKLYDNLINALIYNVRQYHDAAKAAAKEKVYAARLEYNSQIKKAGRVLKLFTDDSLSPETTFADAQQKAFQILPRKQLTQVADSLIGKLTFDETALRWEHVDTQSRSFKRRLRPIVLTVDFEASSSHAPLLEAVTFLKDAVQKGKSPSQIDEEEFSLSFVPDRSLRYLYQTDSEGHRRLLVDRYEFLVYRRLWQAIEAGHVFCRDSLRFRRLDDDLISEERWAREKDELIAQTGLFRLQTPVKELLASLNGELEGELRRVNERILSGENSHVRVKKRGQHTTWTLPYPRSEEGLNDPFFDEVEQIDIHTLLYFVHQQCRFLDAFEHILPRYAKHSAEEQVILACLVAWGTNMGLRRLGVISDIDFQALTTASDNFLRPQTLKAANDLVTNAIAELPIFRYYDIAEQLHSSSDGQKFETLIHTLNARHSSKYFGLKKGIVVITLVANHIPVNADIIGANEHESHYVFDLMYNNVSDVQPTVHSTDTHGTNQVNFAILDFFGKQFAPRYQAIRGKVQTSLYGFQHPSQYPQEWLLKPIRKLNEGLIIREWDTIQRIIVSLALKTTTQSIIVSKLSSHTRRNDTRQALWEYDNILASLYLLKYIDSPPMRRGVQQALNRGESYHHLHRAVSYANFGKLRFKTEYDQHLWSECSRLIANCIIFYNASILSALLLRNQEKGHEDPAALLRHISPVAWQHINFYGRFEFASIPALIDIASILQAILARAMPPDTPLEL